MKHDGTGDSVRDVHPLLLLLDAAVRSDEGASGLQGTLAVGVLGDAGVAWWEADFSAGPSARLVDEPSEGGTWLLLGESDADAVTMRGEFPEVPELAKVAGDRDALRRFCARYLAQQSPLALRSAMAKGQVKR